MRADFLAIGNLSSEKVTKRDIFHVFHAYGDLAQISIKQAYGFVQFLRAEDCGRALDREQGTQIRDKRIREYTTSQMRRSVICKTIIMADFVHTRQISRSANHRRIGITPAAAHAHPIRDLEVNRQPMSTATSPAAVGMAAEETDLTEVVDTVHLRLGAGTGTGTMTDTARDRLTMAEGRGTGAQARRGGTKTTICRCRNGRRGTCQMCRSWCWIVWSETSSLGWRRPSRREG